MIFQTQKNKNLLKLIVSLKTSQHKTKL